MDDDLSPWGKAVFIAVLFFIMGVFIVGAAVIENLG